MSSLYLHLARRIEEVAKWVALGTDTMRAAREAKGWSYETTARAIPTSSKTYERWEKRGEVPNHALEAVAAALDLEIERAERSKLRLAAEPDGDPNEWADVSDRLTRIEEQLEGLLELVRSGQDATG